MPIELTRSNTSLFHHYHLVVNVSFMKWTLFRVEKFDSIKSPSLCEEVKWWRGGCHHADIKDKVSVWKIKTIIKKNTRLLDSFDMQNKLKQRLFNTAATNSSCDRKSNWTLGIEKRKKEKRRRRRQAMEEKKKVTSGAADCDMIWLIRPPGGWWAEPVGSAGRVASWAPSQLRWDPEENKHQLLLGEDESEMKRLGSTKDVLFPA